ncbi:MAG: 30S ribosomal protein S17e [Thaumarchaeota archaeon]|nr:30S ribosomal protein S17e [Nitrososphaerota archaeon]
MDRIRRYSLILLERYPSLFTEDFETNKELLKKVAKITSKELRNEIAGYLTRMVKKGALGVRAE